MISIAVAVESVLPHQPKNGAQIHKLTEQCIEVALL